MPDSMNQDATPEAVRAPAAELQTLTRTNSACKQGGKNREWRKQTNQASHGANTPTHSRGRNRPNGNQSALNPDRRTRQTRLIQMISQLCCLIREKELPLQSSAALVSASSGPGFPAELVWLVVWSAVVLLSCSTVSSLASALAWPPVLLQGADTLEGGGTVASDSPVPAQSQAEEVTRHSRWPT